MTVDYTQPPTPPQQPMQPQGMPGQPLQPQQKGSGCWKWGACGCAVIILLICLAGAGGAFLVFRTVKSTFLYKDAVHRAQSNPQVIAALGEPIETGFVVTGGIDSRERRGSAHLSIPLHGSKDGGTIEVEASMAGDQWRYDKLIVKPDHGPTIDLMPVEPAPAQNP
jgi:cytochrome oxidase complex assembly protein 1